MVKKIICFILGFSMISCGYVILPHKYFDKYTEIKNSKNNSIINDTLIQVYMKEDTFLSKSYSEWIGYNIKSFNYIFLYRNNLIATINSPVLINNNKPYIISIKEIVDSIENGFFERPNNYDKIHWTYYKKQDDKFTIYNYDYNIASGLNALTRVNLREENILLTNKDLIYENKSLKHGLYLPVSITIKPDSSKSSFTKSYNKYLQTGKRRHYPYYKDFEKYINSK
jgi:hypothetical protein